MTIAEEEEGEDNGSADLILFGFGVVVVVVVAVPWCPGICSGAKIAHESGSHRGAGTGYLVGNPVGFNPF